MTRVEIGDICHEDHKHKIIEISVTLRFPLITPVEEKVTWYRVTTVNIVENGIANYVGILKVTVSRIHYILCLPCADGTKNNYYPQ